MSTYVVKLVLAVVALAVQGQLAAQKLTRVVAVQLNRDAFCKKKKKKKTMMKRAKGDGATLLLRNFAVPRLFLFLRFFLSLLLLDIQAGAWQWPPA